MEFCIRTGEHQGEMDLSCSEKGSPQTGRASGSAEGRESNMGIKTPRHKYRSKFEIPGVGFRKTEAGRTDSPHPPAMGVPMGTMVLNCFLKPWKMVGFFVFCFFFFLPFFFFKLFCLFFPPELRTELRTLSLLGKSCTTKLNLQPQCFFSLS